MQNVVAFIHIIICVLLITMVLMQRGKGGDGLTTGNNAGYFGSSGSGNLLTRLTTGLAIGFFVTCLTLGVMSAGA